MPLILVNMVLVHPLTLREVREEQPWNISVMFVSLAVFHPPRLRLVRP